MAKLLLLYFTLKILCFFANSNDFEGIYQCTLGGQDVYLKIVNEDGLAILEILEGKQKYSKHQGNILNDSIVFSKIVIQNRELTFTFYVQNSKVVTINEIGESSEIRIYKISENANLKLGNIPSLLKNDLDPNLIGNWTLLYSKDEKGSIIKDEFKGKGYIIQYTENGKLILDPRAFRENLKASGIMEFSYKEIPTASWKTEKNQLIVHWSSPQGNVIDSKSTYLIKRDTLFKFSPNGSSTIHIRGKK